MDHLRDCERIRLAISAALDGEEAPVGRAEVDEHLASCAACRAFRADAETLHRRIRLGAAPAVPDLTPRVLAAIGTDTAPTPDPRAALWRIALAVLAAVQIAVALPALLLGDDAGLPVHTARHLGSFSIALAVGFLWAAWRPSRIAGLVPLAAALVLCLVGTSVLDVVQGRTGAVTELAHAPELLGLLVLWFLSRDTSAPRVQARAA